MASFLTDGRKALLAAIKADAAISAKVKTWFEFNRLLKQRFEIEPAECTAYALHPGRIIEPDERYNAAYDLAQEVIIVIAVDSQIPDACEELIELTFNRVRASRSTMLGLSSQGLKNLRAKCNMAAWKTEAHPRLGWQATITVTLEWIRFN